MQVLLLHRMHSTATPAMRFANPSAQGLPAASGACHQHVRVPRLTITTTCLKQSTLFTHSGFQLPAEHVIHTVGPVYDDDKPEESRKLLTSAYVECLRLANKQVLPFEIF